MQRRKNLAARLIPRNLEEFVGQEHLVGENRLLRRSILADCLRSAIFWGPSGVGKTALAHIIANYTKSKFIRLNAVTSTIQDLRQIIEDAKRRFELFNESTLLLIDEIHRFNKPQQDALLQEVEEPYFILIGTTVENPSFAISPPLLSRTTIYQFLPLEEKDLEKILYWAKEDKERGFGNFDIRIREEAKKLLINYAAGDARRLLNAFEIGVITTPNKNGKINFTLQVAKDSIQKPNLAYQIKGDAHYNYSSAFIKSIRGSDPDATLYYLACMLERGEEPRFIARRLIIAASEEVGCAEPLALVVATAAAEAVEKVGLPECALALAEAAVFIACAPKSNSVYSGLKKAKEVIKNKPKDEVPPSLRDTHYKGAKELFGYGKDYLYPHNFKEHFVLQDYLPSHLKKEQFFFPTTHGYEKEIKDRLKKWWKERNY